MGRQVCLTVPTEPLAPYLKVRCWAKTVIKAHLGEWQFLTQFDRCFEVDESTLKGLLVPVCPRQHGILDTPMCYPENSQCGLRSGI